MEQEQPTCDTCGKPATNSARDTVSIERSETGTLERKPVGGEKYGCDEHPVESESQGRTAFAPAGRFDTSDTVITRAELDRRVAEAQTPKLVDGTVIERRADGSVIVQEPGSAEVRYTVGSVEIPTWLARVPYGLWVVSAKQPSQELKLQQYVRDETVTAAMLNEVPRWAGGDSDGQPWSDENIGQALWSWAGGVMADVEEAGAMPLLMEWGRTFTSHEPRITDHQLAMRACAWFEGYKAGREVKG